MANKEVSQKTIERQDAERKLAADYLALSDHPVILDLLAKLDLFIESHTLVAIDRLGVGPDGKPKALNDPSERLSHLDRAAGLDEIKTYLNRRLAPPKPNS